MTTSSTTTLAPTTTSQSTTIGGLNCEELCANTDANNASDQCCSESYCLCMAEDHPEKTCGEGQGFCPSSPSSPCVSECETSNCCNDDSTLAPSTTSSVQSTTSQEPSTTSQELSTTTQEPSTTNQEPSTTSQEPSTTTQEPSTTSVEPSTSESTLDCDALCADMEAIKVSDGCCTTLFCQCTNGQENYLYSCYDGDVFCNAYQQCLKKDLCLDNAQQCCDVGLQTTTTTTTIATTSNIASTTAKEDSTTIGETTSESGIKSCEELCEGLDHAYVGNYCLPNYCYCLTSGHFDMDCTEENTLWCPEQETCIANFEENCYGGGGSTTSVSSEGSSTTTAGTSENPTTTQGPSTTTHVPSPTTQEPSTTTQEPSPTTQEPSTTSAEPSTSEQTLDCDALCADMEAIKVSDGCCTTLFCQCTK